MRRSQLDKSVLAEVAGWCGAGAIFLAYILVTFSVITADSMIFQLLNLTGAIGFVVIAAHKHVKQSIILNVFWAVVALVALAQQVLR